MLDTATGASDAELLASCRAGDEAAWETLVQRYQRLVYSIPRRSGMNEDQAGEIFQRTFVKLLENLERIAQPDRLPAWLITTAKRETWRFGRRERETVPLVMQGDAGEEPLDLPDDSPLPEEDLMALEQQHAIRTALAALDERCQKLLTMLYFQVEPPAYAEIARQLGVSEGSIGPTRARCLDKLRKQALKSGL
jgi:RNA polymerase sigma factor (sigma-70 family)